MNIVMCNECGWIGKEEEELLANDTTLDETEHCPSCGEKGFIADVDDACQSPLTTANSKRSGSCSAM